jgi:hypothetical protein
VTIAITSGPTVNHGSGSGSLVVVLTGVNAGDFIVVGVGGYEPGGSGDNGISSITISGEANATVVGALNEGLVGGAPNFKQFATLNSVTTGGSKTITVNFTGTVQFPVVNAVAVALSGALGVDNSGYENQTTNSVSNPGVSISVSDANSFILSLLTYTVGDATPGSSYTGITLSDNNFFDTGEYRLAAGGTGTQRVAYASLGSGTWHAGAVAIKPSATTPAAAALVGQACL